MAPLKTCDMPISLWSPSEVLRLDPNSSGFTCIGYAPSKGRRCHNPIASANRQEAANILREMSMLDPHSESLDKRLEGLAPRLLCRRWHQNQASNMKTLWRNEIEKHYPATVRIERYAIVERYSVIYAPSVAATSTLVRMRAEPRTTSQTTSLAAHSSVQVSAPEPLPVAPITEARRRTRSHNDLNGQESRPQAEPSPTSSTQPDVTLQERNLPEPNSPPTSPVSESTRNTSSTAPQDRTAISREALHESSSIEPVTEPTTKQEPPEEPLHAHTRRTIEGDCSICCEELSTDDATVWCKAQCRQNFHVDCINTWHGFQGEWKKSCPYW